MATHTLYWRGQSDQTLERCQINTGNESIAIHSEINGIYDEESFSILYRLVLDRQWNLRSCRISMESELVTRHIFIERSNGRWMVNRRPCLEFDHCTDIDISLTPLTNSLPINRMRISVGEEKTFDILYLDLMENRIGPVRQSYRRDSETIYHFESVPNDFQADISVDADGFVTDYPQLFKRQ